MLVCPTAFAKFAYLHKQNNLMYQKSTPVKDSFQASSMQTPEMEKLQCYLENFCKPGKLMQTPEVEKLG